jgi:hypothetical protein
MNKTTAAIPRWDLSEDFKELKEFMELQATEEQEDHYKRLFCDFACVEICEIYDSRMEMLWDKGKMLNSDIGTFVVDDESGLGSGEYYCSIKELNEGLDLIFNSQTDVSKKILADLKEWKRDLVAWRCGIEATKQ